MRGLAVTSRPSRRYTTTKIASVPQAQRASLGILMRDANSPAAGGGQAAPRSSLPSRGDRELEGRTAGLHLPHYPPPLNPSGLPVFLCLYRQDTGPRGLVTARVAPPLKTRS
ncbi:hypothetical protein E2C01_063662 [Portunus trituberculatus]|uniref:Uncharacterized protein n=1 Tax=Portunus trituberculatus TaxID=210409 RepID=A0A5B7HL39_PORTR|nr:hypothetical protein [Portunus trituberculatus]